MSRVYRIQEAFYSPQGEGHRVGTINVFLRFSFCNIQCVDAATLGRPLQGNEVHTGWNCDTFFSKPQYQLSAQEVVLLVRDTDTGRCKSVIFTGGEPSLQVDAELCLALKDAGYYLAIETNGTRKLPVNPHYVPGPGSGVTCLDWVSCSPKPGTKPALLWANEVRCVIQPQQTPDALGVQSPHKFVSPAARAPDAEVVKAGAWRASPEDLTKEAMSWAVEWCGRNPSWRLSFQAHKVWGVR